MRRTRSSSRRVAESCRRPCDSGRGSTPSRRSSRASRRDARARDHHLRGQERVRPRPRHGARPARGGRGRGGIPTWLGAHAVPPEHPDADAYVDWLIAEVLPDAARIAGRRGRLRRAGSVRRRAGAPLPPRVSRAPGSRSGSTATSSEIGAVPLAVELGARSVDHLEATGPAGIAALAASDVVGVLLPVARSTSAGRCRRPRARRRRRRSRARHRLQPGERLLREPAGGLHARLHAARAHARGGARGLHRQRRARARLADRGRVAPGFARTSSFSTPPTGGISHTTSPATSCIR